MVYGEVQRGNVVYCKVVIHRLTAMDDFVIRPGSVRSGRAMCGGAWQGSALQGLVD